MARCLVTGGTGFLGRHLVDVLLERGCQLTLLIRNPQDEKHQLQLDGWREKISLSSNGSALDVWEGDLSKPNLGLTAAQPLSGFAHIYHLAAIYDLNADPAWVMKTNVEGTETLLARMVETEFSGCLHFVSSIAVAGDFQGNFSESMFDEGQAHPHTYHLSKFESEACVRSFQSKGQFSTRIYRPSAIVGHSKNGVIDKIDGPYYMFILASKLKRLLPAWAPLVMPSIPGVLDMVAVDYVADALATISLLGEDEIPNGQFCFHLTNPASPTLDEAFKMILRSADGPRVGLSIPFGKLSKYGLGMKVLSMLKELKAVHIFLSEALKRLGLPETVFEAMMSGVRFSATDTTALLSKQEISPPPFQDYIDVLWDYYNRHLDPAKNRETLAENAFSQRVILITGGSSGIGYACAKRALTLGSHVILVARHEEKLTECAEQLESIAVRKSLRVDTYACDLSKLDDCDLLVSYIKEKYGAVDVLFNNAGRSIRRSISRSQDRFHDLERTMQLNYFGASRLMLGLLPGMIENGGGHILHSSSMGTMAATPRFGPYMASKNALDTLMDSAAAEYADRNIMFTSIKFPLVKTNMVAPTAEYKDADLASPEFAAQMFVDSVIDKPRKQISNLGVLMGAVSLIAPSIVTQIYNYAYQIWPDESGDYSDLVIDRALVTSIIPHSPL